ncbi:unnamed protein product [Boreogadus saida]
MSGSRGVKKYRVVPALVPVVSAGGAPGQPPSGGAQDAVLRATAAIKVSQYSCVAAAAVGPPTTPTCVALAGPRTAPSLQALSGPASFMSLRSEAAKAGGSPPLRLLCEGADL